MSEHPLDLSTRVIDTWGEAPDPTFRPNRITEELSELGDGVALVESFSHAVVLATGDGLVVFDVSTEQKGPPVLESIRGWNTDRIDTVVYTHGHLDHVGGSGAFAAAADDAGQPRPQFVGHENVPPRFARYRTTSGYNRVINLRQFGGAATDLATRTRTRTGTGTGTGTRSRTTTERPFLPASVIEPDVIYDKNLTLKIGDFTVELNHCKGETDDHTWAWIPERRMVAAGDQFIWNFPNCGNPQKVQRYPLEWAMSLRAMAAKEPELFVPAHGLPIAGVERIRTCLLTVAATLEQLVFDVVEGMNSGATLDAILHSVSVPDEQLALPYMRPMYDEPEFVIRNIWRLYGGWYDGNPARLKPPSDQAVGTEIVDLVGSVDAVIARAQQRSEEGDHRLACHLIELAAAAEPESHQVHDARRAIYTARRAAETSLMAKGIFKGAAANSEYAITGELPPTKFVLSLD